MLVDSIVWFNGIRIQNSFRLFVQHIALTLS